ncbi:MAG: diacylglycerol kinase [Gammaproteobacteria bacterium]|nr:diacylglycerol kinase [Gammaproteobacteria bacterium]
MGKPPPVNELKRIVNAANYSRAGLKAAFRYEAAFRTELLLAAILAPLALWLGDNGIERVVLLSGLFLVLVVELLNSAVEAVVDRIGPEHHELSGRAKDIGSAAVFVATLYVAISWTLVLAG